MFIYYALRNIKTSWILEVEMILLSFLSFKLKKKKAIARFGPFGLIVKWTLAQRKAHSPITELTAKLQIWHCHSNNPDQVNKQKSTANFHKKLTMCLGKSFCPSHFILWDVKNGLKMVWNGLKKKICWMVWLCEFRSGINGWDLKILYKNLKSWKKWLKKNEIEWNGL